MSRKSRARQKPKPNPSEHADSSEPHLAEKGPPPTTAEERLNPDPFRGKELKLPPSPLWQIGLCILASIGFGVFVMSMSAVDSHKCALAIAMVVALKLFLDTLHRAGKLPVPQKLTSLPPAMMLLGWFVLIAMLFIVVRTLWPDAWDLNVPIGIFSIIALVLYLPVLRQAILAKPN